MQHRAVAAGGERVLAGIGPGKRHEVCDRFRRKRGVHAEHDRPARDHGDRREVLEGLIRHLGAGRGADHQLVVRHEDGVAVGRRLGDEFGGERTATAAAVFRHERLARALREALGEHAAEHIGAAAGRRRDHKPHGPIGIRLRMRPGKSDEQGEQRDGTHSDLLRRGV